MGALCAPFLNARSAWHNGNPTQKIQMTENVDKIEAMPQGAIRQANAALQGGRFFDALEVLSDARKKYSDALVLFPHTIRSLIFCGEHLKARALVREYLDRAVDMPQHLAECAQLLVQCQLLDEAVSTYRQLAAGGSRDGKYNLAVNLVALGNTTEAEEILTALLESNPTDGQAQLVKSGLNKATTASNDVAHIESLLAGARLSPMDRIQLHYAVGRELEDLQEFPAAFAHFQKGANLRRRGMQYRVEGDLETLDLIRQCHGGGGGGGGEQEADAQVGQEAVFVLGLPRSGTTLVDRILSSHSDCRSLGEITDFPMSLMVASGRKLAKSELVRETARWAPEKIAQSYLKRLQNFPGSLPRNIDKTPQNFLYASLITRSMPGASVIWMDRHPLDACFAMYKTLFQMGYPFSYDLSDLGRYYIGYWKLKSQWQDRLQGKVRFQRYDRLVEDFPRQARELVSSAKLDWQPECEAFHHNRSAVATASSVQVRQPLYKSAVAHWRHYEHQLEPLAAILQQAGVPL
nr:tetratricopeptide repeat-containing sulfotransferase family protein [Microbulbifer sp. CAU 1566]